MTAGLCLSRISILIMNAQDFIQTKLNELKSPLGLSRIQNKEELVEAIFRYVTSKKFRKYALSPEASERIRSSIAKNVEANEPIKATLVFGGYKLWRFDEAPEADWAELFSLIYYSNWMKPICEIYEYGVWYDFFSDDVIVSIINNIPPDDTLAYGNSFKQLLHFLKPYQPANLDMTYNRVGDQYESFDAFRADLEAQTVSLSASLEGGYPSLDEKSKSALDLNVKLTEEQETDPLWREKVQLLHDAYMQVGGRRPYYRTPDKFNVMTTPLNGMLSVGTTKDSIMKFWVGTGVLKPRDDGYRQIILSPNQLEKTSFDWQDVSLGIEGKNFKKIRIVSNFHST